MKITWTDAVVTIAAAFLLTAPFFIKFHSPILSYAVPISLIAAALYRRLNEAKYERKFYQKWHIVRQRNYWVNIVFAGLSRLVYLLFLLTIPYYIVAGSSPLEVVREFSTGGSVSFILVLLLICLLIGRADVNSKERRYKQIAHKIKDKNS